MKHLERWPFFSALVITLLILTFTISVLKPSIEIKTPDFASIENVSDRKQLFFSFVDNHLQEVNQSIVEIRNKLLALDEKEQLRYAEKMFIDQLARNYHIITEQKPIKSEQQIIEELLLMVDQIPPALVLAQAASESAWGTSRFAKKANNYFGIWCFTRGCGLVPNQRNQEQVHEVKSFTSVKQSIRYYVKLLNSSDSYQQLRQIRATLKQNNSLSAQALLPGLSKYSERGEDYIKDISAIIRFNKLDEKYPLAAE